MKCCFVECANEGEPEPGDHYFACADCMAQLKRWVDEEAETKQHPN